MGVVFSKLNEVQIDLANEITDLIRNIQEKVLKPLYEYQKDVTNVRDSRKELKDAYDKINQSNETLEKARRELTSLEEAPSSKSFGMLSTKDSTKKMQARQEDVVKQEDKVIRLERELDDANYAAKEKYDKYTESLYKRVAEESELTNHYLEYLKCQKQYHKQSYKRLDAIIPVVKSALNNYPKKPVFGSDLTEYFWLINPVKIPAEQRQNYFQVSPVIKKLCDEMTKQGAYEEEGIFRVPGSKIKMNCLLNSINAGYLDYIDMSQGSGNFDVHCLAGVLKQYIRELPDSILCNRMYEAWIEAINTTPHQNKLEAFRLVLNILPKANYDNLRYLIKFLARIVDNSEKTKMTASNMGICFGVSLLSNSNAISNNTNNTTNNNNNSNGESNSNDNQNIDMATSTNIFDFILTNHHILFPENNNNVNSSTPSTSNSYSLTKSNFMSMKVKANTNNINNKLNNPSNSSFVSVKRGQSPSSETDHFVNNVDNQQEQLNVAKYKQVPNQRYSVMIHDTPPLDISNDVPTPTSRLNVSYNLNNSLGAGTNSILNTSRHIKNNSVDYRMFTQNYNNVSINSNKETSNDSQSNINATENYERLNQSTE
jgi:hypothetical protein